MVANVFEIPLKLVTEGGAELATITLPVKLRATGTTGRGVRVTLEDGDTLTARLTRALEAFSEALDEDLDPDTPHLHTFVAGPAEKSRVVG